MIMLADRTKSPRQAAATLSEFAPNDNGDCERPMADTYYDAAWNDARSFRYRPSKILLALARYSEGRVSAEYGYFDS